MINPNKYLFSAAFRLETLVWIRWLAIAGQSVAVLFVHFYLGFKFPLLLCFVFIASSALLNIYLRIRFPGNVRLRGRVISLLLGYDILQLSMLLYLTGGIENPFSVLLAVPVVVSAATQRGTQTLPLFILALGAVSALVFFHYPLPWYSNLDFSLPLEIKVGIWAAIASTMAFTSFYTFRLADESRKLSNALSATELMLEREQHVSNLDGLAAAAAHELGTPLATISVVSKEMLREMPKGSSILDDAVLLNSQADRCREILKKISSLSSLEDETIARMPVTVLMEEIVSPHRDFDVELEVQHKGEAPTPVINRNPAVLYGLGNLIENAVDFAKSTVSFSVEWDKDKISFKVQDDGNGFAQGVVERIGDPFISTRTAVHADSGGGQGLGLFIAKTLLERNGATLTFSNTPYVNSSGAVVEISWVRSVFEKL